MSNVRLLNNKYGISKHRFRELYYYCLQYNEWKEQLECYTDTVKSLQITDMPISRSNKSQTEVLAVDRYNLTLKCALIESVAKEADQNLYKYILKAVTNEGITYNYLKHSMNIPCGKDMYYDRRRKFYWLLDKKQKME